MSTINLTQLELTQKIESKIVQIIENAVPVLDRSEATVRTLNIDLSSGIAQVKVDVIARNSPNALIPVSVSPRIEFDYNLPTGETSEENVTFETKVPGSFGSVDGPDISIPIGTLRDVCDGDFSKALELIPNGGLVERKINSNYDRIKSSLQNEHGGAKNVYFASPRFVRWAGIGTAARWVAQAITSSGTATADIMREIESEARKELSAIVAWLENRGNQNANQVINDLLSGTRINWPFIKVFFQTVRYSSHLIVGGKTVGPEFAINNHAGFVIIWKGTDGSTYLPAPISDNDPLDVDEPDTPPLQVGPFNRTAKIRAHGRIHDDDSGDFFGGDEEEPFMFSQDLALEGGGPAKAFRASKTVDGEVRLKLELTAKCRSEGILDIEGSLELWEGETLEFTFALHEQASLAPTSIRMNEKKTLFEDRIADNEGNFADVKLTLLNDVAIV